MVPALWLASLLVAFGPQAASGLVLQNSTAEIRSNVSNSSNSSMEFDGNMTWPGPAPGPVPGPAPRPAPSPAPVDDGDAPLDDAPAFRASQVAAASSAQPSPTPFQQQAPAPSPVLPPVPAVMSAPSPVPAPGPTGPFVFSAPPAPSPAPVPAPQVIIISGPPAPGPAPSPSPVPGPMAGPSPMGFAPVPARPSVEGVTLPIPSGMQEHPEDPLADCFEVPSGMCLQAAGGQNFVLQPTARTDDLVLWYDFDKNLPVDESGSGHHLIDPSHGVIVPVPAGPGILGQGASMAVDGELLFSASDSDDFSSSSFTVALWVYILQDSTGAWRTIFQRGESQDDFAPALLLAPDERRLNVRLGFGDRTSGLLRSVGILPMRRWTHIAVACGGDVVRLYINGLQDSQTILEGSWQGGKGMLHLGRDKWRGGVKAFLDDFRWYRKQLSEGEIKALTYPSLTGISADFVHLGCASCTYAEVVARCEDDGLHLCSTQEMYEGGYHVARAMGWLAQSTDVWHQPKKSVASTPNSEYFSGTRKLG
eukprot:CAMPEP_0178413718 /NCGR_PEP_ID=MMETSP0689_2-20121128/22671_1 /TAXON_ID=160604 /ORGANISM="Amphidinium massartii, Strain CS-259" /LENGTH=533 /DNA_ID=CAMNT_0020034997 /DNA_START=1 /DNA_END=1599 /DNA_ORIENTATION=+